MLYSEDHEHAIENTVVMISLDKRVFTVLAPPLPSMTVLFSTAQRDRYGRELSKASVSGQLFRKFRSFKGYKVTRFAAIHLANNWKTIFIILHASILIPA